MDNEQKTKINTDTSSEFKCKKTAFIGHRHIYFDKNLTENLFIATEQAILSGCLCFTMGTHGDFDREALSVCRTLKRKYKDIEIEVVITSFAKIKPIIVRDKFFGDGVYKPYEDVKTIMYDIEELHFKQITESNKQMIDSCDNLICYVDENYKYASGAKTAYNYAKKKGLQIVNLFQNN